MGQVGQILEEMRACGYDSEVISSENIKQLSSCNILLLYGVDQDCGFHKVKADRRIIFVPGRLGDIGLVSWTLGWDSYGFADSRVCKEFVNRCKGAYVFIVSTSIDTFQFLDSELPPLDRTLHLVSVLEGKVDNLEKYISAVRESHTTCSFSFICPEGTVPSGRRIFSYRPSEISLVDLFRKGNCFWLPITRPLSDSSITTLIKATAFGLPIVADAETIGQFTVDNVGWTCSGVSSCRSIFSQINGEALVYKGMNAKIQMQLCSSPNIWCREILGNRLQSSKEVSSVKEAQGGSITSEDAHVLYLSADEIEAKNILEIGSRCGGSTVYLGTVAKKYGGHLYCIDPITRDQWYANVKLAGLDGYVTMIKGASPWVSFKEVVTPLDYLFIDGDHHTRWVIADYHYWIPFVRIGGRVAFHDWGDSSMVGNMVRKAIGLILQTDTGTLKKVDETQLSRCGVVVFEKVKEH
jgi:predicted O-methyltransferase YrrM